MKIWALYGHENAYEPQNDSFIAWWEKKPDFETLAQAIGVPFRGDANVLCVVNVHQGQSVRLNDTDYSLVELKEGIIEP